MTTQAFILALIQALTPVLLAILTYLGITARRERGEIREKITEVAHSVNGMKAELVEATAKGSYLEGAKDAAEKAPEAVLTLAAEVAKEVLATAEKKAQDFKDAPP